MTQEEFRTIHFWISNDACSKEELTYVVRWPDCLKRLSFTDEHNDKIPFEFHPGVPQGSLWANNQVYESIIRPLRISLRKGQTKSNWDIAVLLAPQIQRNLGAAWEVEASEYNNGYPHGPKKIVIDTEDDGDES